jgi:hypothetical protein
MEEGRPLRELELRQPPVNLKMRHADIDKSRRGENALEGLQGVGHRSEDEAAARKLDRPQPAQRIEGIVKMAQSHLEQCRPFVFTYSIEGEYVIEPTLAACQGSFRADQPMDPKSQAPGRLG